MLQPRILIVGAGAAGIAAASRLMANNINNFTILEAENRIGGRISSTEIEGAPVDLGAQWVHGEVNNVCHSLGSSAGLLSDDSYNLTESKCILSDGTFMKDDVAWKLYSLCKEILADEETLRDFNGSLGDYINQSLLERLKSKTIETDADDIHSFLEWFHRFQNSLDGSDSWFETSAQGTLEYHECEGNLLTRWKSGGYSNILYLLMKTHSDRIKEKILFNKNVKSIHWDQNPLEVLCTDGHKFTADHVILTVSLGVLKENMSQLFLPPLPPMKTKAIQGLGIGTVNKIFLKFPYRWWPKECTGFSLLRKKNYVPLTFEGEMNWLSEVFGFYSVDSSPLLLCGWVVGPAARLMEQCSDQLVQDGCHQLLVQFLGKHYTIPPPDSLLRSKWNSNPHFRGSYSFRSVDSDKSGVTAAHLASPLCLPSGHPGLLFAGEATHDHFYSTVHGAIETGWREAGRLISFYSKSLNGYPQNGNHDPSHTFSVIIVGAGMAGLGAAKTLKEAGIKNFAIFEGQEQAGGRVHSVPIDGSDDSAQNYIELGAQWVHGEHNPIYELANQEQLMSNVTSEEGQGPYLKADGEEIPLQLLQEVAGVVGNILEDCCQFVNKDDAPESIEAFLTQKFTEYLDSCNDSPKVRRDKLSLLDWHKRFHVIDNSCDQLSRLSAKDWGLYQYSGGTDYNNFRHGYSSLVHCLIRDLPTEALRTQSEVKLISYSRNSPAAKVICEDGEEYFADHVIVTSSLGYLKEHSHTMFDPPLPLDISKAIECMGFDTINKLFLVYDSPWWNEDLQGIQLIWDIDKSDPDLQNWMTYLSGFDVLANAKGVLLGWVGGKGAVTMETLTEGEIANDCTMTLRKFMKRQDIPLPDKVFRSRWHSNKFVRGGYSHTTTLCDKEGCGPETLAKPIYVCRSSNNKLKHPVLMFAGEAVHKSYFSTTHGAFMSGTSQAQIIIDYLVHLEAAQ